MRGGRRIACLVAWAGLAGLVPASGQAAERWPSWPSEVHRHAAPLHVVDDRISGERDRATALVRLEEFATPVIAAEVLRALQDSSSQVRREALRLCYLRRIETCIDEASRIWGSGTEPTLRIAALRVLALELDGSRLAILLGALRDPSEELRAQAAQILGWAAPPAGAEAEVRAALLAKLSDSAALVRRRAVESLGLLGPGTGTLAMARLLDDPEPTVRASAAEALARTRDERAAPALIRAAEGPNEAVVSAKILEALALLPGEDVARALMRKLDDPPPGLSAFQVADAIGNRPHPEAGIVEGLVERLREPELGFPALRALLRLGEPTAPVLRRALERGLDPSLQLEIEGLLDALNPPSDPPPTSADPREPPRTASAWAERLRTGTPADRLTEAARLGALAPDWLDAVVGHRIERSTEIETLVPWLVAAATASRSLRLGGRRWLPWAKLHGYVRDASLAPSQRCLALLVLSRAEERPQRRRVGHIVDAALADVQPEVRACAALASVAWPGRAELALADPDPRVRVAGALAIRAQTTRGPDADRLELLQFTDHAAAVRTTAAATATHADGRPRLFFVAQPQAPRSLPKPRPWIEVEVSGQRLLVPAFGELGIDPSASPGAPHLPLRWAIVPLRAEPVVVAPDDS